MELILSKEYLELIDAARKRNPDDIIDGENHHVYMASLAGKDSEVVRLTYGEHYLAHKYLAISNPDIQQCQSAWWNLCSCTSNGRIIASPEDYAEARKRVVDILSKRIVSEETKEKIRKTKTPEIIESLRERDLTNNPRSIPGVNEKIIAAWTPEKRQAASDRWNQEMKDKQRQIINDFWTEEKRLEMSIKNSGKNNPMYGKPRPEGGGLPPKAVDIYLSDGTLEHHFESCADAERFYNKKSDAIASALRKNGYFYINNTDSSISKYDSSLKRYPK